MRKFDFLICLALFFVGLPKCILGQTITQDYYRCHYIIVVDQGAVQAHVNLPKLYDDLVQVFDQGVLPQGVTQESYLRNVKFNPTKDEISIYESGISWAAYSSIYNQCVSNAASVGQINNQIVNGLFRKHESFRESQKARPLTVQEYFELCLKSLMCNQLDNDTTNQLDNKIKVGINEYLYPLILAKMDFIIPAEEYIIIRISNFTSQGGQHNVKVQQLEPLLAKKEYFINGFDEYSKSLESPFYLVPAMKLVRQAPGGGGNSCNSNNNPKVFGDKLGLVSLQSVGLKNMNIPHFIQKEYGIDDFEYDKSIIQFTHDKHLKMQKVIFECLGERIDVTGQVVYDSLKSNYVFPAGTIEIENAKENDSIDVKYVFYAQSYDDAGKPLLPMVFTSDCQYCLSDNDFKEKPVVPEEREFPMWAKIALALVAAAIFIFLLLFWRKRRGANRKAWVEFEVLPVSGSKYMDVRNQKVVLEDCWYMGSDNQNQKITIEGQLKKEQLVWCKNYTYRLEYRIEDADSEEDFTFRPDGQDSTGHDLKKDEWYRINVDQNGKFKLVVWTYLDLEHSPEMKEKLDEFFNDPEKLYHILKLHVKFRVLVLNSDEGLLQLPDPDKPEAVKVFPKFGSYDRKYSFIVRPKFERREAWIAFDPGTTGSCAAFSYAQGNPGDPDIVTLAMNQSSNTEGDVKTSCIFPSVVKISDKARCFKQHSTKVDDVLTWEVDKDFVFGNKASQRLGNNRFQSIKKLLGYTSPQIIKSDTEKREIQGKDLAALIVKGLFKKVGEYAMENDKVDRHLRELMSVDGQFAPQRAIVAVPNNYTLRKIQEMVDSVKKLGCFKEVHYLYESEAVMMKYLYKNWSNLKNSGDRVFFVYDMGGATINATAFAIKDILINKDGNTEKFTLETISKIGYCVGGDDIDYALIRFIYDIPAVSECFNKDENNKKENMSQNKQKLIRFVTLLKLELIDKLYSGKTENLNIIGNDEDLFNQVSILMERCGVSVTPDKFTEKDKKFVNKQLYSQNKKGTLMYEYVYSKVKDAVSELMKDIDKRDVTLIFSGRSSLYPFIQDFVKETLNEKGCKNYQVWDGFNDETGHLDADAVKTAVAEGACWYAAFNSKIHLQHDIITSSFGFIDEHDNCSVFKPVVKRNERFVRSEKTNKVEPSQGLKNVRFVQMLGSDYDTILSDYYQKGKNKHKMNVLDVVRQESVDGRIETIAITVDDKNNFSYEIETSSTKITPKENPYSYLRGDEGMAVKTEITDENNEAYSFAALRTVDEKNLEDMEVSTPRKNRTSRRKDLFDGMGGSETNEEQMPNEPTDMANPEKKNRKI